MVLAELLLSIELRLSGQCRAFDVGALEDPVSSLTVTLARVPPDGILVIQVVVADRLLSLEPGEDGEGSFERGISTDELRLREILRRSEERVQVVIPWEETAVGAILLIGVV